MMNYADRHKPDIKLINSSLISNIQHLRSKSNTTCPNNKLFLTSAKPYLIQKGYYICDDDFNKNK